MISFIGVERGKSDLVSMFIKLLKDPKKMHFDSAMRWIHSAISNTERLEIVRFLLDEMEIPILNGKSDDEEFTFFILLVILTITS
jgi:predicted ATPase